MRATLCIVIALAMSLATCAQAHQQNGADYHYRWVDATGLAHYSDNLNTRAVKTGYDILNNHGMVVRHVRGQLSSEQRKLALVEAARAASTQRADQQKYLHDRRLLQAYPTESAFKAAQNARIKNLDQDIHTTRANLDSQEHNLTQLLNRAADIDRGGNDLPKALQKQIDTQRQAVLKQRQLLKRQLAQKESLREEAFANLAYYRQLQSQQKGPDKP